MAWSWELLVRALRSMGGTADNVARRPASAGGGLAPTNPAKPIRIHIPANLIVAVSDIEFVGDRLKIKAAANIGNAERSFLDNYFDGFCWGGSGKEHATSFINALGGLPPDVREILSSEFGMAPLLEGGTEQTQQWLLRNRRMSWHGTQVLVPLIESIRHDQEAAPCIDHKGMVLAGKFDGEVLMRRSLADPFTFFRRFGYASPEWTAFAQPLLLEPQGCRIDISNNINVNGSLGSTSVPEYRREGNTLNLSCMMLGHSRFPRLARGIFRAVTRHIGLADVDETFDVIQHQNRMHFLKLMRVLESHEGAMATELRRVARYQLEALSCCVGAREL
jgi:hypothetical protein